MTFVTSPKNIIKNINQVFLECDIEIERLISGIFALGAFHLNETELNLGSILIRFGKRSCGAKKPGKCSLLNFGASMAS